MNYWQQQVTIGNLSFPRFIGGPLDRITDSPFRQLVREFSQDNLLYTEMRHVACVANDRSGKLALDFEQMERPLNFQIAASSEDFIDEALEKIIAKGVDLIDLNIGCPARNVTKSGSGSALMADLPRLKRILLRIAKNCTTIPYTVKIRAGYKEQNALEVAQLIQDCGAAAVAIHPRLQTQKFIGRPDYALAAQVKKALQIPVLLSGNVVNFATAKMAYEQTGVDGYLIGRGMWSKPWKLREMELHAAGEPYATELPIVMRYALKHLDHMLDYYPKNGLHCFRKHLPFYLRGVPGASSLRQELVISESADHVRERLLELVG